MAEKGIGWAARFEQPEGSPDRVEWDICAGDSCAQRQAEVIIVGLVESVDRIVEGLDAGKFYCVKECLGLARRGLFGLRAFWTVGVADGRRRSKLRLHVDWVRWVGGGERERSQDVASPGERSRLLKWMRRLVGM